MSLRWLCFAISGQAMLKALLDNKNSASQIAELGHWSLTPRFRKSEAHPEQVQTAPGGQTQVRAILLRVFARRLVTLHSAPGIGD